eukprot:TRINITY_DN30930_c0_g2_i1.p1 TRINITY_DN30930_c0_g2~~TRINITY_DN30930_c0_g2_i1.p1  ORF type:complete len:203 (+),score=57.09 TRINITY_DN30930_c0_g2_i1:86-694(+)
MSDDEGPRGKGKGKKGGKGGGKGGGGGGGGKGDKAGGGRPGTNITRNKVLPKFLQDMQNRMKPEESKRGLTHARLEDKTSGLGRNDDDEYDIEGAQVVGDEYDASDLKFFQKGKKSEPKTFFAAEAKKPDDEEPAGPMTFKRKADRADGGGGLRRGVGAGGASSGTSKASDGKSKSDSKAPPVASAKRTKLSFDADDDDEDD